MKIIKQDSDEKIILEKDNSNIMIANTIQTDVYNTNSIYLEKNWCDLETYFKKTKAWWISSSVDIYDCDLDIMRDSEAIKFFVKELCKRIKMKRFQDTQVVHFWENEEVAWYSMTQLIETSLVSWHFANKSKAIYLDIFSCKYYDPIVMANYAQKFFKWKSYKINVNFRDNK